MLAGTLSKCKLSGDGQPQMARMYVPLTIEKDDLNIARSVYTDKL